MITIPVITERCAEIDAGKRGLAAVAAGPADKEAEIKQPDTTLLKHLEREKQVRRHARRLRQLGADDQTVESLVAGLLQISPDSPQPEPSSEPPGRTGAISLSAPPRRLQLAPSLAASADFASAPRPQSDIQLRKILRPNRCHR